MSLSISPQYSSVTDRHTDGRTLADGQYRIYTASRGKIEEKAKYSKWKI